MKSAELMSKDFAVAEVGAAAVVIGTAVAATGWNDVMWGVVRMKGYHNGREGVVLVDVPGEVVRRRTPN